MLWDKALLSAALPREEKGQNQVFWAKKFDTRYSGGIKITSIFMVNPSTYLTLLYKPRAFPNSCHIYK
jgi:hypothetical protein